MNKIMRLQQCFTMSLNHFFLVMTLSSHVFTSSRDLLDLFLPLVLVSACFLLFSRWVFFLYSYLAPTCLTRPATTLDAVLPVMCTKQIALKGIMEDYHHFFIVAFYCLHENSFASPKRLLFMTRRETFMIFLLADDFISLVMRNTLFR